MGFFFTPPTVDEAQPDTGPLLFRYRIPRGVTVLNIGGLFVQRRFPALDELIEADQVFLGGHRYEVNASTKAALEAAGYTVETV